MGADTSMSLTAEEKLPSSEEEEEEEKTKKDNDNNDDDDDGQSEKKRRKIVEEREDVEAKCNMEPADCYSERGTSPEESRDRT